MIHPLLSLWLFFEWFSATAVQVRPKMVSVGTQTIRSNQTIRRTSTPLASPEKSDEEASFMNSDVSWMPDEDDVSSDEEEYEELSPNDPDLKWEKSLLCQHILWQCAIMHVMFTPKICDNQSNWCIWCRWVKVMLNGWWHYWLESFLLVINRSIIQLHAMTVSNACLVPPLGLDHLHYSWPDPNHKITRV